VILTFQFFLENLDTSVKSSTCYDGNHNFRFYMSSCKNYSSIIKMVTCAKNDEYDVKCLAFKMYTFIIILSCSKHN
jgi:hypothetical protein